MKEKIIEFKARSKDGFETQIKPYPASQSIPDWWRNGTPYQISPDNVDGKKLIINNKGESNATFKKCTPMLDAMITGYIIPLWSDVVVTNEDEETEEPRERTESDNERDFKY
jgi:hypothetical protein